MSAICKEYITYGKRFKPTDSLTKKIEAYATPHEYEALFPLRLSMFIDYTKLLEYTKENFPEYVHSCVNIDTTHICPNSITQDHMFSILEKIRSQGQDMQFLNTVREDISLTRPSLYELYEHIVDCNTVTKEMYDSCTSTNAYNKRVATDCIATRLVPNRLANMKMKYPYAKSKYIEKICEFLIWHQEHFG